MHDAQTFYVSTNVNNEMVAEAVRKYCCYNSSSLSTVSILFINLYLIR